MIQPARLRHRAAALVATVAILGMVSSSAAFATPLGSVIQVTNFSPVTTNESCGSTAIVNNPTSGVTLAAWSGSDETGGSAPLQVAIVGADGAIAAPETYQPDAAHMLSDQGSCEPLSIDAGANGGFIVTWNHGDNDIVLGILVDSAGVFIGDAFTISSNSSYSDIETTAAAWSEADSRYLVTWKAGNVQTPFPASVESQQVIGRFIDENGVGIGSDFLVTDLLGIDDSQDLAFGAGTWVAVVVNGSTVVATTISAAGTVGVPLPVASPGGGSRGPSIAFNSATNQFLVVSKTNTTIWGQLLTSAGALSGAPFVIASGSNLGKPRLASMNADGWIITWHAANAADVVAIELSAAGAPIGVPEFLSAGVNNLALEANFRPEIAFSAATGQAYAFWSRHNEVTDETNLVLRAWGEAPALAATGLDESKSLLLGGAAALALIAGVLALTVRRRRATS